MKPMEIREQKIKSNQQFTKPPPRQCSFSYRHILHRKQNDPNGEGSRSRWAHHPAEEIAGYCGQSGVGEEVVPANWRTPSPTLVVVPLATGVRRGFRGARAALAERHSDAAECASCKEGWDGGDSAENSRRTRFAGIRASLKSFINSSTGAACRPKMPGEARQMAICVAICT